MKKIIRLLPLFLIGFSFIAAFVSAPNLPPVLVTHWGIDGQPDGFSTHFFGLYFMPLLTLGLYILFRFLPRLDPYKNNYPEFINYYDGFVLVVTLFLTYLYLLTLLWNFGVTFNFIQLIVPGFTLLLFYCGVLMAKTHQNWFVGIRTPWTMSNPLVWKKTHQLGGKLFKLSAVLSLIGIVLPQLGIYIILISMILTPIILFAYSYWEYRNLA